MWLECRSNTNTAGLKNRRSWSAKSTWIMFLVLVDRSIRYSNSPLLDRAPITVRPEPRVSFTGKVILPYWGYQTFLCHVKLGKDLPARPYKALVSPLIEDQLGVAFSNGFAGKVHAAKEFRNP